jgi:hypothetical protein
MTYEELSTTAAEQGLFLWMKPTWCHKTAAWSFVYVLLSSNDIISADTLVEGTFEAVRSFLCTPRPHLKLVS